MNIQFKALIGILLFCLAGQTICKIYEDTIYVSNVLVDFYQGANTSRRGDAVSEDAQHYAIYFNNSLPGPTIRVNRNDEIHIKFQNRLLMDSVAIHWHGQIQRGTPWADGAAFVNQCPVLPNSLQEYWYNFTATKAGTYWYHGHVPTLYQKGMYAPLIIEDPDDPYKNDYEDEIIWTFNDWTIDVDQTEGIHNQIIATSAAGGAIATDATKRKLKNKKSTIKPVKDRKLRHGRRLKQGDAVEDLGHINGMWGDGSDEYPYPAFDVKAGKCYRIRMICVAGFTQGYGAYIANHTMSLIAVDAVNVEKQDFSVITTYTSQRNDVIVCANETPGDYFITLFSQDAWVAGGIVVDSPDNGAPKCTNAFSDPGVEDTNCFHAIWRVTKDSFIPNFMDNVGLTGTKDLIDGSPQPLHKRWDMVNNTYKAEMLPGPDNPKFPEEFPTEVDGTFHFFTGHLANDDYYFWQYRDQFVQASTPPLFTKMKCGLHQNTHFLQVKTDSVYDFVVNNLVNQTHPLHIHGHRMWQIGSGKHTQGNDLIFQGDYQNTLTGCGREQGLVYGDTPSLFIGTPDTENAYTGCVFNETLDSHLLNFTNPLFTDTMDLASKNWVYIRVKFDNPGPWVWHCHLQDHQTQGMTWFVSVGDPETEWPEVPDTIPKCGPCAVEGSYDYYATYDTFNATSNFENFAGTPAYVPPPGSAGAIYKTSFGIIIISITITFLNFMF